MPLTSWAALPFITDDTGTQGKGKYQLELAAEYGREREAQDDIISIESQYALAGVLTCGITARLDVFIGTPYVRDIEEAAGTGDPAGRASGIADTVIGSKWHFYERKGLSLALKPTVFIPTGDWEKGLGTGKARYLVFLLLTQELGAWAVHANGGYISNENKIDERTDLWHASVAAVHEVVMNLKVGVDLGAATNSHKTSSSAFTSYLLGGMIYSATEALDLSLGVKYGLSMAEVDWVVFPGLTWRF